MDFNDLITFLLYKSNNPLTIEQLQVQWLENILENEGLSISPEKITKIIKEIKAITVEYFDDYHFILIANATNLVAIKSPKDVYTDVKEQKPTQKLEIKLNESVIFTQND